MRVVVIGGGFGGLRLAQRLGRRGVDVTLLDKRNFHLFQPLLYQVATGGLSPGDIAAPLRSVLRRYPSVRVLQHEVTSIDPAARCVWAGDQRFDYDRLVVAVGARHHYFGNDDWELHAPGLKSVEDAMRIRARVLGAFERAEQTEDDEDRRRLMTFVIVGAGPTGVELAGAIGELRRHTLRNDFRAIRSTDARVLLVEAGPRILPSFPESCARAARVSLERLGVEVRTETRVDDVGPLGVHLGDERVPTESVVWAAGVAGRPLTRALAETVGLELAPGGRIPVEADCSLRGHPEIYAIGDMAWFEQDGHPLPGVAQVAMQQATFVAKQILRRSDAPFRYRDPGSLAVIGRAAAVADLKRLRFSGYPAWLLWLFVHLMGLVEFESRLLVATQWAYGYVTRKRGARLITEIEGDGRSSTT